MGDFAEHVVGTSSDAHGPGPMRPVDPHAYIGDDAPRRPLGRRILAWVLAALVGVAVAALVPGSAIIWAWLALVTLVVVAMVVSWAGRRRSRA
ncbi:hypothetical protein SAMN05216410_1634 [Sanguibacter gelidistatuariae]|uniref:Uncharacterized protein n=1 Tax=Sanguibacter gelidistatuariae TaxID=1814289 RepID=A0A1G6KNN9_9MICO|nr:hypothetical protein [Sanguibacter gelidistatuariae]SDC32145.1 hypothetical protein SAMN05216410_1634 [Sanguibacter gelidistatuariae]